MASTQEPWPPTPVPALAPRSTPELRPTYGNVNTNEATFEAGYSLYRPTFDLDQSIPFVSQHDEPGDPSSNPMAADTEGLQEPSYDSNHLSPNVAWSFHVSGSSLPIQASDLSPEQRSGVDPVARAQMGQAEIPSLEDQARTQKLDSEISKVRNWLATSSLDESNHPSHPVSTRRSRSATSPSPGYLSGHPAYALPNPPPPTRAPPLPPSQTSGLGVVLSDDSSRGEDEVFLFGEESNTPPAPIHDDGYLQVSPPLPDNSAEKYQSSEPWTDFPQDIDSARIKEQPHSSNAAISIFMRKAKDLETASLTATLGSRRRSETDLSSLYSHDAVRPSAGEKGLPKSPNKFRKFFTKPPNPKKRGHSQEEPAASVENLGLPKKGIQGPLSPLRRARSRSRGPEVQVEGQPPQTSSIRRNPMNVINRLRSASDLGGSEGHSYLAKKWSATGGPPVPNLRTQDPEAFTQPYGSEQTLVQEPQTMSPEDGEGDDEVIVDTNARMSFRINEAPKAATKEAFKAHASMLNPRVELFMLERLTQEQDKRFHRLVEYRQKHQDAIKHGRCPSGTLCSNLGNGPNYLTPSIAKGAENSTPIFYVSQTEPIESMPESGEKATFPEGIPLPPVERLPAEFECPLCFQVKKILKPSDWTKHVNEDIQPFTCTFAHCPEAKSFKRKADWVRHESERHRQLESWQCDLEGCNHRCYRRDNFVQHLVREHRLPEPRVRITRSSMRGGSQPFDQQDIVAQQVERCRRESTKRPRDEPCRFCGNSCESWRKLSVHLALHMQQISIPILTLLNIEVPPLTGNTMTPPLTAARAQMKRPQTPTGTSLGSLTPGTSQPSSGKRPQAQWSMSSSGLSGTSGPSLTVTDTDVPENAPTQRPNPTPGWMMQGTHRDDSRYPVSHPPGASSPQVYGAYNFAAATPQMPAYSRVPLTPQTPGFAAQGGSYSSTSQLENQTPDMISNTYPSSWISGQAVSQSQAAGASNVLEEAELSTSPVPASPEMFSGTDAFQTGGPTFELSHDAFLSEQQAEPNQYYGLDGGVNYSQSFDHAGERYGPTYPLGSDGEGQNFAPNVSTAHHSATYPPQYFP